MAKPSIIAVDSGILAELSVDLPSSGTFTIRAELFDEDTERLISVRPHHRDPRFNHETLEGPGEHHLKFHFAGEDVYRSPEEGRFGVKVTVIDGQGRVVGQSSALASEIEPTALGETLAKIAALDIAPLDANENGKYEALQVTVQLDKRRPHSGAIVARLASSDDVTIGYAELSFDANDLQERAVMRIPAGTIVEKKLSSPYELSVELLQRVERDEAWRATGFATDTLAKYHFSDFERLDDVTILDLKKD